MAEQGFSQWEHLNKHIYVKQWYVIYHPFPNIDRGYIKPPLKLGHGWEIGIPYKTRYVITYPRPDQSQT